MGRHGQFESAHHYRIKLNGGFKFELNLEASEAPTQYEVHTLH